jgi:L-ascorbate metabolism protein UlaG (beta-lactamase superfamily)
VPALPSKGPKADVGHLALSTQASLRIREEGLGLNIHIDPFQVKEPAKTDLIFITHPHFDHCDPNSIAKLYTKGKTRVVAPAECFKDLKGVAKEDCHVVAPGQSSELFGVPFATLPAYNLVQERAHFHPKEKGWVGYVLKVNRQTLYHAGDTDLIPEMEPLASNLNLGFLCAGGTYTMSVDEALKAAEGIKADITVPMHMIPVDPKDVTKQRKEAERFKAAMEGKKMRAEVMGGFGKF